MPGRPEKTLQQKDRGPLDGLSILDMATVLAAPYAATLCADLGADVVKLELPDGSDPLRQLAPVEGDVPLFWKVANRGKRGITLDVRKPEGRALLLRMLPRFDVLVENFRAGTLERWGLDLATLHAANPRLLVLRLTGFGQTGPYRQRPGFARIFEAMSGFTTLSGEAGGPPMHMNYPLGDVVAGVFGAFAICAEALRLRGDPEARGAEIDLAATEAMFRLLDPLAVEYERLGLVRRRTGNLASYTAPSNVYRSGDGVDFTLVASSDAVFRRLCAALDWPALAEDARFRDNVARVAHRDALDAALAGWFAAREYGGIAAALEAAAVPFSKAYSIEDVLADPQYRAREAVIRLPDPELGSVPAPCVVPRVTGRNLPAPRSGPATGEHNLEVYGALGVAGDELERLREAGVV
ncbi:CaiB/BaiF CoA transferase family protein [Verticiella sediminum]|nr:CoA transferase [Verticiella sediminum]